MVSSKFAKKMEHKSIVRVPLDGKIPLVSLVEVNTVSQLTLNYFLGCDSGFNGINCKKRCGHCSKHSCDLVSGKCDSCSDNYVGAKCDIPPVPVFSEPPVMSDIEYSEATVKVKNFELANKNYKDPPDVYYVEYRKARENSEWMASDQRNPFNKSAIIILQHLEPNTEYIVRSVITTIDKKPIIDENLPHAAFTTKCYEITDHDFISSTYNTSIRVTFNSKFQV
ncbi:uncharacterized protein [Tenebrio molitor]|uniref:uncharacterized protein n=1 Tax=Tenebrio molitor TaxID=7067 RepID=UPI0036246AA6